MYGWLSRFRQGKTVGRHSQIAQALDQNFNRILTRAIKFLARNAEDLL